MNDLRTERKKKGLRIEDLCCGMLQPGTIISIEKGQRVPHAATRKMLESVIGPVDWCRTLAAGERDHILFALREFVAIDEQGAQERIKFARQALKLLSDTTQKV